MGVWLHPWLLFCPSQPSYETAHGSREVFISIGSWINSLRWNGRLIYSTLSYPFLHEVRWFFLNNFCYVGKALESVLQFDMEYRDMAYAYKLLCKDSSCYRTKISQETARLGTDKSQANDNYLIPSTHQKKKKSLDRVH